VVPFDPNGLETTYIIGGGYKYCQFGEGNCFLRSPADCTLRPVITGWFADFASLEGAPGSLVQYGSHPGARFAGATYDPISHYRAARVAQFFEEHGLTLPKLRKRSQEQIQLLVDCFDSKKFQLQVISRESETPLDRVAGFLSLKTPHAARLQKELTASGVLTDYRNDILRLGPAPYITDEQLTHAVDILGEAIRKLS
jgi:kynureninase